MNKSQSAWLCAGLALVGQGLSAEAGAVTQERGVTANAVTFCQPALPTFDGLIRKRPLAVQNEGDATAFITCGLVNDVTSSGTRRVFAFFLNAGPVPQEVSCTLVTSNAGGVNLHIVKSVMIAANTPGGVSLQWDNVADNGGTYFSRWTALSCSLPAGTGIGHLGAYYNEEIGT